MTTRQWNRQVKLTVGDNAGNGLDLSALRIVFQVRHADLTQPNTADIRIYNVSPQTAARAEREFTKLTLEAGYPGNAGVIFRGTIVQTRFGRESPTDTYLAITAMDGDVAWHFAVMNKSLAAGTRMEDQMRETERALAQYGVQTGHIEALTQDNPLPRGVALFGMVRDYMRDYATQTGHLVSIQNGVLQAMAPNSVLPGEAIVLTSETGLIGVPEQTMDGITFTALLNPQIVVGRKVVLDNASIQRARMATNVQGQPANLMMPQTDRDGRYRVLLVDHHGDTRGNPFYSRAVCVGIDAPIPTTLANRGIAG